MRDVSWHKPFDPGRTRVYVSLRLHRGVPRAFVVQLELYVDGTWHEVVRFDHDMDASGGHDVREEGLHMDVYRDGEKIRVERDFPYVELTDAPAFCIDHVTTKHEEYVARYRRWQD